MHMYMYTYTVLYMYLSLSIYIYTRMHTHTYFCINIRIYSKVLQHTAQLYYIVFLCPLAAKIIGRFGCQSRSAKIMHRCKGVCGTHTNPRNMR